MSDHIEHTCTNCGSLLHHANRCDKPLQRNPDATPQPAEPPAGAAEDEDTNKKPNIMGWMDVLRPTPPPQPQENQRVETPAAGPAETNASVIGSCAGSSPASLQPQGGTPEVDELLVGNSDSWGNPMPAMVELARTLERQRNESRAALAAAQAEVEDARAQGCPIDMSLADWFRAIDRQHIERGGHLSAALEDNASLRAELEQTRRELEKTKARLETYWKKGDEDFATLLALRAELEKTRLELRLTSDKLQGELRETRRELAEAVALQKHTLDNVKFWQDAAEVSRQALTAAEQRAEGAEKERDEARTAWMAKVDELAAQRDTAIRERDEAKRHMDLARAEAGCPDDDTLVMHCREAAKDSARLDWLEKCNVGLFVTHYNQSGNVRAAIDAALAAKTTEGGV